MFELSDKMVMDVIQSLQPEDILAECKANMADKSVVDKGFTQDHIESNSHNVGVDFKSLMENEPAGKASIKAREEIVQPLLTIQQFALMELQELKSFNNSDPKKIQILEAMITRSLFGNINDSRNSA